jgi:hypothetical protein
MAAFRLLFSLRCSHEFFSGGLCTSLDFVPTAACEHMINNAGLLLRQDAGHLAVYCDADRLGAIPDAAHFDFHARARDYDFPNYTEGLATEPGKTLYLCATGSDRQADGRLSREDFLSSADLCPEPLVPSELRAGSPSPAFLVRLSDTQRRENPAYFIPLRARRTTWQYFICAPGMAGSDLYVATQGDSEAFEYRGEVDLPNGRQASHFRSKVQFPLLHEQPVHYALRERYNGRLVVRKLPTPSPRSLSRENFDGEEVLTSQMFVNL